MTPKELKQELDRVEERMRGILNQYGVILVEQLTISIVVKLMANAYQIGKQDLLKSLGEHNASR
jgi:hypothetical protein